MYHYYTIIADLRLSIIFCPSSGDICLSLGIFLGIPLSFSFVIVSKLSCCKFYETFVIVSLLCYYFTFKSSVISCLFSGDISLSLDIYLSCSFVTVSESFETP